MLKKFWAKVIISLYQLNMYMGQVDTLHVGRYMYWSEVLCYTITAHLRDLEVKVMGHRLIDLVTKHKSGELRRPATALIA